MNKFYDKYRNEAMIVATVFVVIALVVFSLFMYRLMLHWQTEEIIKRTPAPIIQAAEQPVAVKANYTMIFKASIPTYITEHYLKDGRIYYIKKDGKAGSSPHIDARLEEGWLPYEEMYHYGFIDFVEDTYDGN